MDQKPGIAGHELMEQMLAQRDIESGAVVVRNLENEDKKKSPINLEIETIHNRIKYLLNTLDVFEFTELKKFQIRDSSFSPRMNRSLKRFLQDVIKEKSSDQMEIYRRKWNDMFVKIELFVTVTDDKRVQFILTLNYNEMPSLRGCKPETPKEVQDIIQDEKFEAPDPESFPCRIATFSLPLSFFEEKDTLLSKEA